MSCAPVAVAVPGNPDNANCVPDSTLDSSDLACQTEDCKSYSPSILIGVPEAEKANATAGKAALTYNTSPGGFVWPEVGAGVTIQVEDSSGYAVGQWLYILGFGYLEVTDIPSETSIFAVNRGTRGNVEPTSVVPAGNGFIVSPKPPEEISEGDLTALINVAVQALLPAAVAAAIDPIPQWDNAGVTQLTSGRVPLLRFDDDESKRRLGFQNLNFVTKGKAIVKTEISNPDDSSASRFDVLKPEVRGNGDLALFDHANPTDPSGAPELVSLQPTDLTQEPPSTLGFLAYEIQQLTESVARKVWRTVKKLVFPQSFMDLSALPVDDDFEVLVVKKDGDSREIQRVAPIDDNILYGGLEDGVPKWKLGKMGLQYTPDFKTISNTEYTANTPAGGVWFQGDIALSNIPNGATHVKLQAIIRFTLEADVNNNGNTHNPAACAAINNNDIACATSIGEDTGGTAFTGSDSGIMEAEINNGSVYLTVYKLGASAGTERSTRVTLSLKQLGFYGRPA